MAFYRTILLAGAVVIGATAAYAGDGKEDIAIRDNSSSAFASEPFEASGHLVEGRASVSEPARYAYEGGSTSEGVPASIRKQDITTEGNDNR